MITKYLYDTNRRTRGRFQDVHRHVRENGGGVDVDSL